MTKPIRDKEDVDAALTAVRAIANAAAIDGNYELQAQWNIVSALLVYYQKTAYGALLNQSMAVHSWDVFANWLYGEDMPVSGKIEREYL
ncbi:MAG: hypothetical protein KDE20_12750 [Caldilineaceae bacterium]|nr:hypothetical protein [Caldilineaceae bacterium]MCB9161625.1 hypothetical protein [Caldilineaceae bacterium]